MGFTVKPKSPNTSTSSSGDNWGMGLLLVFFPENNSANAIVDKTNMLFSPSSSSSALTTTSSPSSSSSSSFKRSNSNSNNVLLSKAQSTISICALLVFITLLLFTLSTFEPSSKTHPFSTASRRFLSSSSSSSSHNSINTPDFKPGNNGSNHSLGLSSSWLGKMWKQKNQNQQSPKRSGNQFALQRMGTLYRRGTKAMTDLVVGHVDVDVTEPELRLFLRLLHRSGLTARADIVFIFASSTPSKFQSAIEEENESFLNLVGHYLQLNSTTSTSSQTKHKHSSGFDVGQFLKLEKRKQTEEPLWGKKSSSSSTHSNLTATDKAESTRLSYGSVVGFEVSELDPENSLAGFLDHVAPMSLRRWACYPMLLGRVRRNFKHIMLVDVKNSVVLGDPLGRARHKSAESVLLSTMPNKHCSKKNSDPTQSHCSVNSAVITGGARGIRRMSTTVLTEIVRAAMQQQQRKRKSPVTESGVLSQLVGNQFTSKNINLVTSTESIPDPTSVAPGSLLSHAVIQRGNSNHHDLNSIIMKQICSSEIDSSVYRDC